MQDKITLSCTEFKSLCDTKLFRRHFVYIEITYNEAHDCVIASSKPTILYKALLVFFVLLLGIPAFIYDACHGHAKRFIPSIKDAFTGKSFTKLHFYKEHDEYKIFMNMMGKHEYLI